MTMRLIALMASVVMFSFPHLAAADADENLRIMTEAARQLKWAPLEYPFPKNRAYILVSKGPIESSVGVIFGYVDNRAACKEIADALRGFECHPVY